MKQAKLKPTTFSEHFELRKSQEQLDFLDIYANQDIALFLDPYGISAIGTAWAKECESQIATYFQYLVDSIQKGDKRTIQQLLNALHEVNEVSLGYSINSPEGRGIGPKQAKEIQEAFETSQAARSGDIKDIADCALMIPGINRDKISDITANILKRELISFTQKQCELHNIPTQRVAVNNAFDYTNFTFTSFFTQLPVINEKAKILLPISSVRRDPQLSKDKYYRNFVLEYLKAEHCHAGDSLATVLRNGRIKVQIKDLKEAYPIGTDFLYKFSKDHPKILEKFKSELRRSAHTQTTPVLHTKKKILNAKERISIINNIKTGTTEAGDFHKIIFDTLITVFSKKLSNPKAEAKINSGRKRIDILFNNSDKSGFFYQLNTLHHVKCPKIIIECKNYANEIGNPEIDQLLGRFNPRAGKFGILVCRTLKDKRNLILRCKDVLNQDGYIIVLEDKDIFTLINLKEQDNEEGIDQFMHSKLDELIL